MPFHRRRPPRDDLAHLRAEVARILETVDAATTSRDPQHLAQALAGDALAEIHARLEAYLTAGIRVHPFREDFQVVSGEHLDGDRVRVRLRYRDRTRFLPDQGPAVTADEPVELLLVLDTALDPWRAVTVGQTEAGPGPS